MFHGESALAREQEPGGVAVVLSKVVDLAYRYGVMLFAIPLLVVCLLSGIDLTAHLIRWEATVFVNDNIFLGAVLTGLVVLAVALVAQTGVYRRIAAAMCHDAAFRAVGLVLSVATAAIGIVWVTSTQFVPAVDEGEIYRFAGEALNGDWSSFQWGGYFSRYPNNWGVFLFDYALQSVVGIWNYLPFEIINAVSVAVMFAELSHIGRQLGLGRMGQLLIRSAGILFFPVALYSQMIYGNVIGMTLACAAMRQAMAYMADGRVRNAVIGAACMALAMFFKSTMLIYLAAILMSTTVSAIAKRSWRRLLFPALVVAMYLGQGWVTKAAIVTLSGQTTFSQIPTLTFVAMGLQDGYLAPGWWNDYLHTAWKDCGGDLQVLSTISKDSIKQSLSGFAADPKMALDFFVRKFLSTWANPSFQCFATARKGTIVGLPDWTRWVLSYRGQDAVGGYLDVFVSVVFAGSLVAVVTRRPKNLPEGSVLTCTLLDGGALYLLVSETKARYALLFWVMLLPMAVVGLRVVVHIMSRAIERLRHGDDGRRAASLPAPAELSPFAIVTIALGAVAFVTVIRPAIADHVVAGTNEYIEWVAADTEETPIAGEKKVDPMYDPD